MLSAMIVLAAALAAAPSPTEFRTEQGKLVDLDAWPAGAARAAEEGIKAFGMPDYFDDDKLLWNQTDGARRTEVRRSTGTPVYQVVETGKAPAYLDAPGIRYDPGRGETEYEGKSFLEVHLKRGLKPARP